MQSKFKQDAGHRAQLDVIRHMTPEQRLMQAFELSQFTRDLFRQGLSKRFPGLLGEEFQNLYLEHLNKCHNQNY